MSSQVYTRRKECIPPKSFKIIQVCTSTKPFTRWEKDTGRSVDVIVEPDSEIKLPDGLSVLPGLMF